MWLTAFAKQTSLGSFTLVGGLIRHKGYPGQHPGQPQRAIHPEGGLPSKAVDEQGGADEGYNVANLAC